MCLLLRVVLRYIKNKYVKTEEERGVDEERGRRGRAGSMEEEEEEIRPSRECCLSVCRWESWIKSPISVPVPIYVVC